jgi:hypothetical protein
MGVDLANITLTIDDVILRKASAKAVRENTSVNAVVREFLTRWVVDGSEHAATVRDLRAVLDASEYDSGGATWTREELHERPG